MTLSFALNANAFRDMNEERMENWREGRGQTDTRTPWFVHVQRKQQKDKKVFIQVFCIAH